jgi:proteasome assembly chaperone (PAC2) family protein
MAVKYLSEPVLENPVMIASWSGIGNIGLVAADTLRVQLGAEKFAEIDPWDFFYPKRVVIRDSILQSLEFPGSVFYFNRLSRRDVITFISEEQPNDGNRPFAEGKKAREMASLVVDVAQKFGCKRLYSCGAAVSLSHHALKPRVWIATSSQTLNHEMTGFNNTVLMGKGQGRGEGGTITGLNGLILGIAKKRGIEVICLMGEVPDYLSTAPLPYPNASKSLVELICTVLGTSVDYGSLNEMAVHVDNIISGIYDKLPLEVRERVERRKAVAQEKADTITEEEGKWMKAHIEDLFKKGNKGNERAA